MIQIIWAEFPLMIFIATETISDSSDVIQQRPTACNISSAL